MRSRCCLHKTKLDDFRIYLESFGWVDLKTKGFFELLRMKHPKYKGVLLVYDRIDAKEHYTVHGIAEELFRKWKREAHNI